MVESIFEYEKIFDDAIVQSQSLLAKIKRKYKTFDSINIDLLDTDYNEIIYQLETDIAEFEKQKVRYKYDKMSREEFNIVLKNVAEGKPTNLITIGKEHKLRTLDTLQLLSVIYQVSVDILLDYNQLTSDEFDDLREYNGTIQIPIVIDIKERTRYSDLPVFGSVNGKDSWGTDWENEITLLNGDVRVLDNENTLTQGISNRFGDYGSIPGYENETIDLDWGRDYSPEIVETMTVAKLSQKLLREPRVREVSNIKVESEELGKKYTIDILPINGTESISTIINDKLNSLTNIDRGVV